MEKIYLPEVFTDIVDLKKYKIHFAKRATNGSEPLDSFMRDMDEWRDWNRYSNAYKDNGIKKKPTDYFSREFIFSLISFYPERDTWLFGGIWRVTDRNLTEGNDTPYTIELCEHFSKFIGRLKIQYTHNERMVRNNMENHFSKLIVKELLDEVYSTYVFPGYRNLDIPFKTLENVIQNGNPAWKNALSLKGIYLITDASSGKIYVGKADGENGIWQRWSDYIADGHGGDVELQKIVKSQGMDYVRAYYKFTLLEIVQTWDEINIREDYWKRVLMSRAKEIGHNRN